MSTIMNSKPTCTILPVDAAELSPELVQLIHSYLKKADINEYITVERGIRRFLSLLSSGATEKVYLGIIKGEWGEGKTTSYHVYVKPYSTKEYNLLSLRTNIISLCNFLEREGARINFDNYAVLLLYLLIVNSEEYKEELKIRYRAVYYDAYQVIENFVRDYLKTQRYKGLVIFVDEVEELISDRGKILIVFNNRSVEKGISIKQIIVNGLREISREFGKEVLQKLRNIHPINIGILLAMTPYTFIEFKNTLGGLESAGKILSLTDIIEVKSLTRYSNVKYVDAVIKSACQGRSINEIFEEPRIINTIHLIGQGNSRAILQLINRLIAYINEHGLNKISYDTLFKAYYNYQFYLALNPIKALNEEIINLLLDLYRERPELYKFLAKSLATLLVSAELGDDTLYVQGANMFFLRNFGTKMFIKATIYKVENTNELFNIFNEIAKIIKEYNIALGPNMYSQEYIDELEKAIKRGLLNLLYYSSKGYLLAFPDPTEEEAPYFLSQILSRDIIIDLDQNTVRKIYHLLLERLNNRLIDTNAYIVSTKVLSLVYQLPTPIIARILRDPVKASVLWRTAQDEFYSPSLKGKVIESLLGRISDTFIEIAHSYGTEIIKDTINPIIRDHNYAIQNLEIWKFEGERKFSKPVMAALAIILFPNEYDLISLIDRIKSKNYLVSIILYVKSEKIEERQIPTLKENMVLKHLTPNDAYQIYVVHRALNEIKAKQHVDATRYLELILGKIALYLSFRNTYMSLREKGYIISDLEGLRAPVEKPYEVLKYYQLLLLGVVERGTDGFIGDIDKAVEEFILLRTIRPYGREFSKLGLLSIDIESERVIRERLRTALNIFEKNGFVKIIDSKRYLIKETPIEKRLLELAEHIKDIRQLEKSFINVAINYPEELFNLYVDFLKSKGFLAVREQKVKKITPMELKDSIEKLITDIDTRLSELGEEFIVKLKELGIDKEYDPYKILGYIQCKKHECKLIKASSIKKILDIISSTDIILTPRIYLYFELLNLIREKIIENKYYEEYIKKIDSIIKTINNTDSKIKTLINKIYEELTNTLKDLGDTIYYNIMTLIASPNEVEEFVEMKKNYELLLKRIINILDFFTKHDDITDITFSPKKIPEPLTIIIDRIEVEKPIYPLIKLLKQYEEYLTDKIDELNKIAKKIHDTLISINNDVIYINNLDKKLSEEEVGFIGESISRRIIENANRVLSLDQLNNFLIILRTVLSQEVNNLKRRIEYREVLSKSISKIIRKIEDMIKIAEQYRNNLSLLEEECNLILNDKYIREETELLRKAHNICNTDLYRQYFERFLGDLENLHSEATSLLTGIITLDENELNTKRYKITDSLEKINKGLTNIIGKINDFQRDIYSYYERILRNKLIRLKGLSKLVNDPFERKEIHYTIENAKPLVSGDTVERYSLSKYIDAIKKIDQYLDRIRREVSDAIVLAIGTPLSEEVIDRIINKLMETGKISLSSLLKEVGLRRDQAVAVLMKLLEKGVVADIEAVVSPY